jgi:hypothetical protein
LFGSNTVTPEAYNYAHFVLDENEQRGFAEFRTLMHAGGPAPDGELVDARTEQRVTLSSLWKRKHLILEFGSFT